MDGELYLQEIFYDIAASSNGHGQVVASPSKQMWDFPVEILATPAAGYDLTRMEYTYPGSDGAIDITASGSFLMPTSSVSVTVTFTRKPAPIPSDDSGDTTRRTPGTIGTIQAPVTDGAWTVNGVVQRR